MGVGLLVVQLSGGWVWVCIPTPQLSTRIPTLLHLVHHLQKPATPRLARTHRSGQPAPSVLLGLVLLIPSVVPILLVVSGRVFVGGTRGELRSDLEHLGDHDLVGLVLELLGLHLQHALLVVLTRDQRLLPRRVALHDNLALIFQLTGSISDFGLLNGDGNRVCLGVCASFPAVCLILAGGVGLMIVQRLFLHAVRVDFVAIIFLPPLPGEFVLALVRSILKSVLARLTLVSQRGKLRISGRTY